MEALIVLSVLGVVAVGLSQSSLLTDLKGTGKLEAGSDSIPQDLDDLIADNVRVLMTTYKRQREVARNFHKVP